RDQRGDVPAERLRDDHHVAVLADRLDQDVRVGRESGCVVLDRQVWRHRRVAFLPKDGLDEMPVPADVTGPVDERVGAHPSATGQTPARLNITCVTPLGEVTTSTS